MTHTLTCWKCAAELSDLLLPLERVAQCRACSADLHVCRMCRFYDLSVAEGCREPVAETVFDKQHANFCGYLELRDAAHLQANSEASATAGKDLEALFGLDPDSASKPSAADELNDLFGLSGDEREL